MEKEFNNWLSTFKDSIADWNYYTDFNKVYRNVDSIKVELNLLNSLINSKNIENDFRDLAEKYPSILKAIPILIAKRESEISIVDVNITKVYQFDKLNLPIDDYIKFMHKTGLFDLLSKHIIRDLTDYVKGVEVGLDTNARKNRTGTAMERIVASYLNNQENISSDEVYSQLSTKEIYRLSGIDLSMIDEDKIANKRFDFVIYKNKHIYAIEVNFYSGGGSKLNETARSYQMLYEQTKDIQNFTFIWITDGVGWKTAKSNLEEAYNSIDYVLSIDDLKCNKLAKIIK